MSQFDTPCPTRKNAHEHLENALEADEPQEIHFHVRQALQLLTVE